MEKTHFKLSFIILLVFIQGCATNDSNSLLVRWWNDGFVYSEKRSNARVVCSQEANKVYPSADHIDEWDDIYTKCMRAKGYK